MTRTPRFPWRIFARTVFAQAALVALALGVAGLAGRYFFERQFMRQVETQLRATLISVSAGIGEEVGASWCAERSAGTDLRYTVVALDGRVLCDSHHDVESMENHARRPEILKALEAGFGGASRMSATMGQEYFYGAYLATPRGPLVRGAIPLSELRSSLALFDRSFALALALVLGCVIVISLWTGRMLVVPVTRILTKARALLAADVEPSHEDLREDSFGEWAELESTLEAMRGDFRAKVETLTIERQEQAILMGAISDAILAVDADERALFFNTRLSLLVGTGGDARSQRLWELFRDPGILGAFRSALREGTSAQGRVVTLEREGDRSYFSLSVAPLRHPDGRVYGAVGVFHDVSGLKRAEQMRIDFVANVSHELRTPLTSIKGYVDTLLSDVASGRPAEQGFLDAIRRNSARLMDLINDLLDLSSIESSDALQKSTIPTREATERVIDQMRGAIGAKRHDVALEVGVASVPADPKRLEQVLTNLLDNAVKYTPPGGKIRVGWRPEGPSVVLEVADSGPGIPSEHQSRVFERFYRVDKARSREIGGTGLGLAIVKHIVQRHGGAVWVESVPGHGTSFFCRFPLS
jgi:two-component system phosphate regulon sensor histidine kinase PhoR